MQTRTLGNSDIQIVPLMLGGNVFGWTIDAPTSFAILDAFVDHGLNSIDTADVYSAWKPGNKGGESETILGQWFKQSGKRDKIVLATKVGMDLGDGKQGLSKKYILEAVEASLTRLQTDRIDLYQSHQDDKTIPLDETLEAYQQLIQQGKVRIIGASNYTGARLAEAVELAKKNGLPTYQVLQPEYNLHQRQGYETDLAPVTARYNIGVIPYYSLARGFLTGKYKTKADADKSTGARKVDLYFDARGEAILKALADVSQQTGATQATIALAWLMAQPTITAPIASATSLTQLQDLLAAVELKLTPAQLDQLNQASAY
jgi:aryl-alcohol dehydrogenase-like predicted oxidoreductase